MSEYSGERASEIPIAEHSAHLKRSPPTELQLRLPKKTIGELCTSIPYPLCNISASAALLEIFAMAFDRLKDHTSNP